MFSVFFEKGKINLFLIPVVLAQGLSFPFFFSLEQRSFPIRIAIELTWVGFAEFGIDCSVVIIL